MATECWKPGIILVLAADAVIMRLQGPQLSVNTLEG